MREFTRDRKANSSFLYRRKIYPYMYTYMSEEGKSWIFVFFFSTFSHIPLTLCNLKKKERDKRLGSQ